MSKNRWKDKYYNLEGTAIPESSLKFFCSTGARNGDGSRLNPYSSGFSIDLGYNYIAVFSSGVHSGSSVIRSAYTIGQGMYETFINNTIYNNSTSETHQNVTFLKDSKIIGPTSWTVSIKRCRICSNLLTNINSITHSILYNVSYAASNKNNNSYIALADTGTKYHYSSNLSTFENCELAFTATEITTTYRNNYLTFQNCKFKIANEVAYAKLVGNTADELRANFVSRCEAQGIVVPTFTEYEEVNGIKMGRWIFTNDSITEGRIIDGSEVANFQKKRGIYFGWNPKTVERLPIVTTTNVPNSFNPQLAKNLIVKQNSIQLPNTFKVTDRDYADIVSKPIWLGGKHKITSFIVANNFPAVYGINIDSTPNIDMNTINVTASTILKKDVNYIVRSSNGNIASFTCGGINYSTSLITRNNILRGTVDGSHTVTNIVGNPTLVPVEDLAGQQTIKMRVVTDIPSANIISGDLQSGYWYIVEPNSPTDLTGTVKTPDNVVHPVYDTFLVDTQLGFTIQGACHLRRMWRQDYTESSEVTDKTFWANKQKPIWIDVVPSDLRCLMKNNTNAEVEMQKDVAQEYIASGHPDFYDLISGANGIPLPAFDIAGTFVQFKLEINSLNPM